MRAPRISMTSILVLIALVAVNGVLAAAGLAVSQRVRHDQLMLRYSWVPEGPQVPRGDPVYAEYVTILDTERLAGVLDVLALGGPPIISVLGLGVVLVVRNLVVRGRCSPFLLGMVKCAGAVLLAYLIASILVPQTIERFARPPLQRSPAFPWPSRGPSFPNCSMSRSGTRPGCSCWACPSCSCRSLAAG